MISDNVENQEDLYETVFNNPRKFKDFLWAIAFIIYCISGYYYNIRKCMRSKSICAYFKSLDKNSIFQILQLISVGLISSIISLICPFLFPLLYSRIAFLISIALLTYFTVISLVHGELVYLYAIIPLIIHIIYYKKSQNNQDIIICLIKQSTRIIYQNIFLFLIFLIFVIIYEIHLIAFNFTQEKMDILEYFFVDISIYWLYCTIFNVIKMTIAGISASEYLFKTKPPFKLSFFWLKHSLTTSLGTAANIKGTLRNWLLMTDEYHYIVSILFNLSYEESDKKLDKMKIPTENMHKFLFSISFVLYFSVVFCAARNIIYDYFNTSNNTWFYSPYTVLFLHFIEYSMLNNAIMSWIFCIKFAPDCLADIDPKLNYLIQTAQNSQENKKEQSLPTMPLLITNS